jgi:RNA polymerase sigma-70 factor (ECF subfamily)
VVGESTGPAAAGKLSFDAFQENLVGRGGIGPDASYQGDWRGVPRAKRMGLEYAESTWPEMAWFMFAFIRSDSGTKLAMKSLEAYSNAPDEELLSWSASGDRRAFDEIVARHGSFALRVASRLVPNLQVAEELVQEAMVRAWSQASHFDPRRARFTTWLYRIVVNLCIDYRRRAQPEPMPENFDPVDPAAGAYEVMEVSERAVALATVLRELPSRQRAAMTLVYDEGISGAAAARVLGLSAKAVERLLSRARCHLRARLRSEHG